MKRNEKKRVSKDMMELGLSALSYANRMDNADKWDELSVLLTAHATEIIIKARIAQEHPLLVFEKFPTASDDEMSLERLFNDGHTIEWSALPKMLWATVNYKMPKHMQDKFKRFGKLRNGIQHFGAVPKGENGNGVAYLEAIKFIYDVVDPLIYKWWKLCAIDYSKDYYDEIPIEENRVYWDYIKGYIVQYQIDFHVFSRLAYNTNLWWDETKNDTTENYRKKIQKQIDKIISQH